MKRNFNFKDMSELTESTNKKFFLENDMEVANYLSDCFNSNDPDLIDMCYQLSRLSYREGNTFVFSEVANLLIEEYIDGESNLPKVISYFKNDISTRIDSPFWHLAARTSYRSTEEFKFSVQVEFLKDPSFFAEVMARARDIDYIEILIDKLTEVSPYIKYLPLYKGSHEVLWEHDFWLRGGDALFKLFEAFGPRSELLPFESLDEMFLKSLPLESCDWLEDRSSFEKTIFERRRTFYLQNLQTA